MSMRFMAWLQVPDRVGRRVGLTAGLVTAGIWELAGAHPLLALGFGAIIGAALGISARIGYDVGEALSWH